MRKSPLIAIMFLASALVALAQAPDSLNTRLDTLRAQGYEALYNLDYDTARKRFQEMIQIAPEHPAGAQCVAAGLWLQQLNESWELKATLYNAKSYAHENEKIDEQRVLEFRKWIRQAKQLSQVRLRRDPHDKEALYFLGAAEGLDAAFSAAVERRFMSALRSASDSVEHHRALLKLDPDFHDAELTIGLYDYIVGALPLPLKILAGSMGVRGSKKRGLQTLERVSNEGHWARDVARVLLVDLYKREKRWSDAVAVARELATKYPRNYVFKLQLADAITAGLIAIPKSNMFSSTDQLELLKIFEMLLDEKTTEASTLDLIHFRYGETLLLLGNPVRALKEFQSVLSHRTAEPWLQTMSQLRVAESLDLAGKRTEALATYGVLLSSPISNEVQDEARRGLREPYHLHGQLRND
jgi:tetratricopeptide (TPR) repeat protein